jgi:hypothetical protein
MILRFRSYEKKVAVVNLDPQGVLDRFERCVPNDCKIEATPFPVVPDVKPAWLKAD